MKKIIMLLVSIFISTSVFAQSADVITELLDAEKATYGEVCYLSAVQQNFVLDDASYDEAIHALRSQGQLSDAVNPDEYIKARDAAKIFASMWNVEGGLMFRITGGSSRYAFKQLQSDGVIPSSKDPDQLVSGSEVLKMYTACVKKYSDFNIKSVSMEAE